MKEGRSQRVAVLMGFAGGLEDALASVLRSSGYSVLTTRSAAEAMELFKARADLFIASGRCSAASVVKLTESLGRPRAARVVVLLAGPDPEAERAYRSAGVKYVMHMPVRADDLINLDLLPPNTNS